MTKSFEKFKRKKKQKIHLEVNRVLIFQLAATGLQLIFSLHSVSLNTFSRQKCRLDRETKSVYYKRELLIFRSDRSEFNKALKSPKCHVSNYAQTV